VCVCVTGSRRHAVVRRHRDSGMLRVHGRTARGQMGQAVPSVRIATHELRAKVLRRSLQRRGDTRSVSLSITFVIALSAGS